jgi:hypothetical protein
MNSRSRPGAWRFLLPCVLLFLPLLALLFGWSMLGPLTRFGGVLLVLFVCFPAEFALLSALINGKTPSQRAFKPEGHFEAFEDRLPPIPRTLAAAQNMDPGAFELLAAAVLLATNKGYHFVEHCGRSGDHGVDIRLLNSLNCPVVVQCKRFADENHVSESFLREFIGAIHVQQAAYGVFVTTSTFTSAASQLIATHYRLIRTIDGPHLEWYLQHRSRDIALELAHIRSGVYS